MISKKYKLDKFMKLTSDTAFHELFARAEYKELLCCLLALYFNEPYKKIYDNIEYITPDLPIDQFNKYKYEVDILVCYNSTLIGIELNGQYWTGLYNRNLGYLTDGYSNQFKKGSTRVDFRNAKPHIQLNINNYNFPEGEELGIFRFFNIFNFKQLTDQLEIHHLNLDKVTERCYTDISKLKGYQKVGLLMSSKSLEDVEMICKDVMPDEDLKKIIERIYELNANPNLWLLYDKEDLERQKRESIEIDSLKNGMILGKEKGKKEGLKEGKEEGLKEGRQEEKIEIARKMLEKNIDVKFISDVTGLTIDEIDDIKN